MKQVVVTGASGLIGKALVNHLLNQGHKVYGFDDQNSISNENYIHLNYDISDWDDLVRYCNDIGLDLLHSTIDEIYHLAGDPCPDKYLESPADIISNAINSTTTMLDLATHRGSKIFIASSSEVYGDSNRPMNENNIGIGSLWDPRACYKESKRMIEVLAMAYNRQYGTNIRIGRIFNTYGKYRTDDTRLIAAVIKALTSNEPVIIYGNGSQVRSYCYIDDTISGIETIMESDLTSPVNIGNPYNKYTVNEVISILRSIIGTSENYKVQYIGNQDMIGPNYREPDITLIKSLGWSPKVNIYSGLWMLIE